MTVFAVLPGALLGAAVTALIATVARPAPLNLTAGLSRLDARRTANDTETEALSGVERVLIPVAARAARSSDRWWGIPAADLDTCEITPTRYLARRLAWALVGAVLAVAATWVLMLLGLGVPVAIVVPVALAAGVLISVVPVLELAETARNRRREFRQALAPYLDLVGQERAAGAAAGPALLDAASVSTAWPFRRLHATLTRAQHTGEPPWDALADLGERMRVPELGDVADIAATAADGAAVHTTLTAKATALRRAELAAAKAAANAASQRLTVPVTLLLIGLLALVLYPAVIRLAGA